MGNGYARETVKSIIKFGISQGIKTFVSDFAAENNASARVLNKCGMNFSHMSTFDQPYLGITYESHVYKLEI